MADLGIGYPVLIDPRVPVAVEVKKGEPGAEKTGFAGGGMMDMGMDMGMGMGMGEEMGAGMEMGMDPGMDGRMNMGGPAMPGRRGTTPLKGDAEEEEKDKPIPLLKFDFEVEFVWQKTPPKVRHSGSSGRRRHTCGGKRRSGYPRTRNQPIAESRLLRGAVHVSRIRKSK